MGNCFSDPSSKKEKKVGHVLGSAPSQPAAVPATTPGHSSGQPLAAQPASYETSARPGQTLGGGFEDSNRTKDPREMARIAAEERIKANSKRGVNSSNAKAGQLSAKLDAERRKPLQASSPRNEENLMDPRRYD
ncbi:hypothetical protein NliqN6_4176 [Naganishia liquefaciens]|uniref:Uncharacterized protein n=1 Tax=Naganishia liquefaciens TaxID=104408 RepID=A0A8H3YFM0_9TREE|nr:hypothetical protein NliqN6_4176 [Naganishia liquefaciens]